MRQMTEPYRDPNRYRRCIVCDHVLNNLTRAQILRQPFICNDCITNAPGRVSLYSFYDPNGYETGPESCAK